MKKVMIVLATSLVFCGMLAGCKKKSDEERVGELIEKQEKRDRKGVREIQVKLGKPFTVWKYFHNVKSTRNEKVTQFSVTFRNTSVSPIKKFGAGTAFPITIRPSSGKEFLKIAFTAKNLGPQKGFFEINLCEVKLDDGNIYEGSVIGKGVEQGKIINDYIWFEIPKGRKPQEITGAIGEVGISGYLYSTTSKFRLKLR